MTLPQSYICSGYQPVSSAIMLCEFSVFISLVIKQLLAG